MRSNFLEGGLFKKKKKRRGDKNCWGKPFPGIAFLKKKNDCLNVDHFF